MNIDMEQLKRKIKEHMWGPIGSVFFHIVAVLLLVLFATGTEMMPPPEIEVTMMDTKTEKLDKEEIIKELEKVDTPIETEVVTDVPMDSPMTDAAADSPDIGSDANSPMTGFEVAMAKSPLVMKGLYANRTKAGRGKGLSTFGGSKAGEEAVMRALRWLKANQDEDGSWKTVDKSDPTAMAGLALLCYLAHGETPASQEFGQTVEKAMKYIVSKQTSEGHFGRDYTHGICTYAISEAFGLTKIIALKDSMDKAVEVIVKGQQQGGGYDYKFAAGPRWDLSVSGWMYQAMKAAKMAGSHNEKLEDAIKKGTEFLRRTAHQLGAGFGYTKADSTPSMTGAGTLCLQLMGKADCPEVKDGLRWMNNSSDEIFQPKWEPEGKNHVYAWYYITQAKFQAGGDDWKKWNAKFSPMLIRAQIVEGPLGHWEGKDAHGGGKVHMTAFSCLMLEVYYRYLPTFKVVTAAPEAPASVTKSDDVAVDVL